MTAAKKKTRAGDPAKKTAILAAATRLFPAQGFTDTSMDAIAAVAGVTKQTVYAHFNSKDELFEEMIIALCDKHSEAAKASPGNPKPIQEQLFDAGLAFLNFVTSDECIAVTRLVISEVNRHPALAQKYYEDGTQRLLNTFAVFLKEQNKLRTLSIPDPESASSYFLALLKGRYYLRMVLGVKPRPTAKDKEENVRDTVAIFMRLYGGRDPLHTHSRF